MKVSVLTFHIEYEYGELVAVYATEPLAVAAAENEGAARDKAADREPTILWRQVADGHHVADLAVGWFEVRTVDVQGEP